MTSGSDSNPIKYVGPRSATLVTFHLGEQFGLVSRNQGPQVAAVKILLYPFGFPRSNEQKCHQLEANSCHEKASASNARHHTAHARRLTSRPHCANMALQTWRVVRTKCFHFACTAKGKRPTKPSTSKAAYFTCPAGEPFTAVPAAATTSDDIRSGKDFSALARPAKPIQHVPIEMWSQAAWGAHRGHLSQRVDVLGFAASSTKLTAAWHGAKVV